MMAWMDSGAVLENFDDVFFSTVTVQWASLSLLGMVGGRFSQSL